MKQEEIAHARIRALAQIMVNKEKGPEVFEEYMKSAFPWIQTVRKRTNDEQIKILMDEVKKGVLQIKGALWQKPVQSRLKTKVIEAKRNPVDVDKLYSKLAVRPTR